MRVVISSSGFPEAYMKFKSLQEAAIDSRPAMEATAVAMMTIIRKTFESGGRRGGGSWARDSVDWMNTKARLGADPRVGFFTGNLFRSMTQIGDRHQILAIDSHSVALGSDLPYAETAQEHRPYIKFLPSDKVMLRNIIRDYFQAAWDLGDK